MSAPETLAPAASPPAPKPEPDTRAGGLRAAAGLVAGFLLVALVNGVAIAARVPRPPGGAALRALHHVFDAAETLGVGGLVAVLVGGFSALVRLPPLGAGLVYAAATAPILSLALGEQLYREACVPFEGRFMTPLFVLFTVGSGLGVAAAHLVGAYLSRFPRLRWIPVVVALATLVGDHLVMVDDYLSSHCAVAWIAATLAGASIAPLAERALLALLARRGGRVALGALAALAAFGLLVPPGNAVRFELFRHPVALAPWALASTVWSAPRPRTPQPAPASRWFHPHADAPPTPPRTAPPLPPSPVVVLITIDATRAEAINDKANDPMFPTLTQMKRQGVWFSRATSPGGQTAVSLSTAFSGRYFSELRWGLHGKGSSRFLYPADDPTPRYPALLTEAGVLTSIYCSINFLAGEYGVARGFRDEKVVPEGRRHAFAKQMIDPVVERLRHAGPEPLFLYTHLMEPHAPYDRGRKDGSDYERYLSEIAVADAQIQRVWRVLEGRFPDRGVLIVSADHGEAFGEHQTREHTKTIYDELLRVPLLIRGAGIAHREVHERVGLIDVGPTILDLFRVPVPGWFQGQSLVPILLGRPVELDRPLLAEGRLRRALYTDDGLKVITDLRRKVVEVYDVKKDPGELRNLWDAEPARADRALGQLEAFFAAHARREKGYRPPYKP